ncbi:MAG: carboxypeptidase-like regulatory domain-containing protein [Candidatus Moduliflexus flocculans]|nr:carboxypeptidase-like regulatory domain-containing protein [Candidatus Moduliflexus flocculans]
MRSASPPQPRPGRPTGKISGTVRDAQNQILPNAQLQLRNVDTAQVVARARSAADGSLRVHRHRSRQLHRRDRRRFRRGSSG